MYTNIQIKLKIDDAEAEFTSTSGVKQGDNLAPILFIFAIQAAIDTMHRNWPTTKPSLEWFPKAKGSLSRRCDNKNKFAEPLDLTDAFYADDSAFVFLSLAKVVTGTQFVKDTFQRFGLEVHLGTRNSTPGQKILTLKHKRCTTRLTRNQKTQSQIIC